MRQTVTPKQHGDIERIPLSNGTFEGHNNAYLLAGEDETALIDTGDWMDATREQLEGALSDRGVRFADIDRIFLTHWHPDHTGLAGTIQAHSGATVHAHVEDVPLIEGDEERWADFRALQERYFDQWGMPEAKQQGLREIMASLETDTYPTVTPFEDGESFIVDGHEIRAVHTSGHAAGLCMFETDADGQSVVFSGDALLPVYTPNVGGADVRVERPLVKYLRALRTITDAGYDRALPGHRDPIEEPAARGASIIGHHEQRAFRVLRTLDEHGPMDTWQVSATLFGDLENIHVLHGPGEAYAHLDHLERAGHVRREGTEYRLADGVAAQLDDGDGHWTLTA